jgi:Methyltransferase domain
MTGSHGLKPVGPPSWDEIYAVKGETEVSWFQDDAEQSSAFLDRLSIPSAASIVDVGAGASRFVDVLLGRGHRDVTVLDVAAAGLDIARTRLGASADGINWVVADLLTWQPGRIFDVWHDRAVFHFLVSVEDLANYRNVLHTSTHEGSVVVIATFAEDGPTSCSGRPTRRYSTEELAAEFGAEFSILGSQREEHITPRGVMQPFTWLALERRPA